MRVTDIGLSFVKGQVTFRWQYDPNRNYIMQKHFTRKAKEKEKKMRRTAIENSGESKINAKWALKLRVRVLTYGPGKGACILRLTLQSVPLETKTQRRTKLKRERAKFVRLSSHVLRVKKKK